MKGCRTRNDEGGENITSCDGCDNLSAIECNWTFTIIVSFSCTEKGKGALVLDVPCARLIGHL